MIDLGLDTLTDDQLVELARALAAELASRNPDVVDAAKAAIAAARAKVIQTQDAQWAMKKWLGAAVREGLGDQYTLTVWNAHDRDETRVYLERPPIGKKGSRQRHCLYVTGGEKAAPGTVATDHGTDPDSEFVRLIGQHAARIFPEGLKLDCDYAARLRYDMPPHPEDVAALLERRQAKRAYDAARAAAWKEAEATVKESHRKALHADIDAIAARHGIDREALVAARAAAGKVYGYGPFADAIQNVREAELRYISPALEIAQAMEAWDAEHEAPK